jgi:hypothetical protein
MKNVNSIDWVDNDSISHDLYLYIGSMMQLFESDMSKSFLNKQILKPYSDST